MPSSPDTSRASARVARTREALIGAGRTLFADHPFDAVAIDDIVGRAGVAKGSFYNHFSDKEALREAVLTEIRRGIEARISTVNDDIEDPAARIARAVCVYAASVGDDPVRGRVLLANDPFARNHRTLDRGLRRDLGAGLHASRLQFPSLEAAFLFVSGIAHSLLHAVVARGASHVSDAQPLCAMMLRGFGLDAAEAGLVASQAADCIIRRRGHEERARGSAIP